MLSHIVTYSNWHGPLCNGLLPPWSWSAAPSVDILSAQEQWIGIKSIPFTLANGFVYLMYICISVCEHTFKISLVVPMLCIQPSISYHTWLGSLACLVMSVYGAIGTWIMFFLGNEDSPSILDGSVVPLLLPSPPVVSSVGHPVPTSKTLKQIMPSRQDH